VKYEEAVREIGRPFFVSAACSSALKNGDLLDAVEEASFDVFITADQEITYQQNLSKRKNESLSSTQITGH
jgi:hypothetical protein